MNKMKAAMIGFLPKEQDPTRCWNPTPLGYSAFEGADVLLREETLPKT